MSALRSSRGPDHRTPTGATPHGAACTAVGPGYGDCARYASATSSRTREGSRIVAVGPVPAGSTSFSGQQRRGQTSSPCAHIGTIASATALVGGHLPVV